MVVFLAHMLGVPKISLRVLLAQCLGVLDVLDVLHTRFLGVGDVQMILLLMLFLSLLTLIFFKPHLHMVAELVSWHPCVVL